MALGRGRDNFHPSSQVSRQSCAWRLLQAFIGQASPTIVFDGHELHRRGFLKLRNASSAKLPLQ